MSITSVLEKSKITSKRNEETGMVTFLIQDESYTLMEPLIDILQADQRLLFAGYKLTHVSSREVNLKLKCNKESNESNESNVSNESNESEEVCLKEALNVLLRRLNSLDELIPDL